MENRPAVSWVYARLPNLNQRWWPDWNPQSPPPAAKDDEQGVSREPDSRAFGRAWFPGSGPANSSVRQRDRMTIVERLLTPLAPIAVLLIIVGVPIFVLKGGLKKFALRPLLRRFEGIDLHDSPQRGDVCFVYHTYRGFLLWFTQSEHRVCAPPADARLLLKRLLRFNLTWGMLCRGLLFVPFLAIGNYYAQKRSIEKQERELAATSNEGHN